MRTLSVKAITVALLTLIALHHHAVAVAQVDKAGVGNDLDAAVKEFRITDVETQLRAMPAGPEHDYFAGIVANRENHIDESIRLLKGALPQIPASRRDRTALALQALADDYMKSFRYADAAHTDNDLLSHFADQLTPQQVQGTKDDAGVLHILSGTPGQTITWNTPVKLKTERNPLNSENAELTVNGVTAPWLLDTGANLSVVSESFAKRLGLAPLPGTAETQAGVTGVENPLHVALISTLPIGGATLHNVVAMILPDASINIDLGNAKYQINAILGYPVLQALGTITFFQDGEFAAGVPADKEGAPMYMKGLSPIVVCSVEGKQLPFTFDTGASNTNLYVRYYRLFRDQEKSWKEGTEGSAGAGGIVKRTVYFQPELKLGFGGKIVVLKNVSIFTSGTGTDTDELYGNLGQDVPANFTSFTLDFTNMTFSLGELRKEETQAPKPKNESPSVKP